MRRASAFTRVSRALVGLVTVWCLGCAGFEPLLDTWLETGAVAGMSCGSATETASTMDMTSRADATTANAGDPTQMSVSVPAQHHGNECGCGQHCTAPTPSLPTAASAAQLVSHAAPLPVIIPASHSQAPLLPPPEFVA